MEMVVQGVSTRKVSAITEELCGASYSKSTVSALCVGLDARVRAFNERCLEGEYPFVLVDALFIKSREEDRVVMRAALVVTGVRSDVPGDSGYQDRRYRKLCHRGRNLPLTQEARTQGRSVCNAEKVKNQSVGKEDVDARLWQDPFAAMTRHIKEKKTQLLNPGGSGLEVEIVSNGESKLGLKATLKAPKNTDDASHSIDSLKLSKLKLENKGKLVVLGAMVWGGGHTQTTKNGATACVSSGSWTCRFRVLFRRP